MRMLQDTFGKKTGETLYKFARGIDDRPLSVGQPRQSVSAEVSVWPFLLLQKSPNCTFLFYLTVGCSF